VWGAQPSPAPAQRARLPARPPPQENVNRLKAFKANLVLFPRRAGKPKAGDSPAEELKAVAQLTGTVLPITRAAPTLEKVAITAEMKVRAAVRQAGRARQRAGGGWLAGLQRARKRAAGAAAMAAWLGRWLGWNGGWGRDLGGTE
jgi:large subunit ribosomal protein L13e